MDAVRFHFPETVTTFGLKSSLYSLKIQVDAVRIWAESITSPPQVFPLGSERITWAANWPFVIAVPFMRPDAICPAEKCCYLGTFTLVASQTVQTNNEHAQRLLDESHFE